MNVLTRVQNRLRRDVSKSFGVRPWNCAPKQPLVSFTFDDFPRSALWRGGTMLREQNLRGTYYASFGLMGQMTPCGEVFSQKDLAEFDRQQHEWGCHTFDHCHAWDTAPATFEASILHNQQVAADLLPEMQLQTLSYPISCARPQTKWRTAKYYEAARGGGQTFNLGSGDRNDLKAFFIEQSREDSDAIKRLIDETVRQRGWLIFATHDIDDAPTRYGCTPALFNEIVTYTVKSGASILPVAEALETLGVTI